MVSTDVTYQNAGASTHFFESRSIAALTGTHAITVP
jgi:hypothetical protein